MKKKLRRHFMPPRSVVLSRPSAAQAGAQRVVPAAPAEGAGERLLARTDAQPHNPALPGIAREQWLGADWQGLSALDEASQSHHPDRARLLALGAAAALQLGDPGDARAKLSQAIAWGCSRDFIGQLLVAGARNTLARASHFANRPGRAEANFEQAVVAARLSSEVRRRVQQRLEDVTRELTAATTASKKLREAGAAGAAALAPAWLRALAQRCLEAEDEHQHIDHVLATMLVQPEDKLWFLMLLSDGCLARQDKLTALHFLRQASPLAQQVTPDLRAELTRKLVAAGSADSAVDLLLGQALGEVGDDVTAQAARQAYQRMRVTAQSAVEHGHDLLLSYLGRHIDTLRARAGARRLLLIEIGTTREDVPGQGSTRKIAEFCKQHGLRFITVDMDPHNTRMASETFDRLGADFEAVTMKGEDFLRGFAETVDFAFLDAYDFDHGRHSELRQSRYEKFLGARIDELACHEMHLDCARSLVDKLWAHGAICVDDTWLADDQWTAKGTLAMPFLLSHGYELVEARNRAALLVRSRPQAG
jgi:hypothetical protein